MPSEFPPHITDVEAVVAALKGRNLPDVEASRVRDAILFALRGGVITPATIHAHSATELAELINEYWRQEDEHDRVRFSE